MAVLSLRENSLGSDGPRQDLSQDLIPAQRNGLECVWDFPVLHLASHTQMNENSKAQAVLGKVKAL